jgi:hypothetical protein
MLHQAKWSPGKPIRRYHAVFGGSRCDENPMIITPGLEALIALMGFQVKLPMSLVPWLIFLLTSFAPRTHRELGLEDDDAGVDCGKERGARAFCQTQQ